MIVETVKCCETLKRKKRKRKMKEKLKKIRKISNENKIKIKIVYEMWCATSSQRRRLDGVGFTSRQPIL